MAKGNVMKKTITIDRGNGVEIVVTVEKKIWDRKIWADGWDVGSEPELYSDTSITVLRDGKELETASEVCELDSVVEWQRDLIDRGAVAYLTPNMALSADAVGKIETALAECLAAVNTPEIIEFEAKLAEKEAVKERKEREADAAYQRALDNGLCPKCGTYCYGDCDANEE